MKNIVDAIIEIPLGSKNKFEIDEKTHRVKLDRVLYSAMNYPAEYGYIENTLSDDGDPLDILVISNAATYPGCVVSARILGYLKIRDNGMLDYKLIAVVNADPRFNEIQELSDLPQFRLDEIKDFFANYKRLQEIPVEVGEYYNKEEAIKILEYCLNKYKEAHNETH